MLKGLLEVVSLIPVSYSTSIRATVLFTSLSKRVSLNSILNVVSSVIICHYDGVPGRSSQDTEGMPEKKVGNYCSVLMNRQFLHC